MTASKLKVLIAEDEPAMLSLVSRHAKNMGFTVVEASDGDAAWDAAQAHRPDLVILDVMMPGMSGWDVCKRIKHASAGAGLRDTGVIMLTGIGENLNEMTSPLFAADGWLNKPFDFPDLDAKVREVLAERGKTLGATRDDTEEAPKKMAAKKTAKKTAAKKTTAKKSAAKKTAAKKPAAKKTVAKKSAAKKTAAKKTAAKKTAAKKTAAKKTAAKKTAGRRC